MIVTLVLSHCIGWLLSQNWSKNWELAFWEVKTVKRDSNRENKRGVSCFGGSEFTDRHADGFPGSWSSWFIVSVATTTEVIHLERVDRDSEQVPDVLAHVPVSFCKMKTVHLGLINQECKYANHYSTHGTNTNVEEECMHVALFRGRSDDGGWGWQVCQRGKTGLKESRKEKKLSWEYEDVQGTAQRHTVWHSPTPH